MNRLLLALVLANVAAAAGAQPGYDQPSPPPPVNTMPGYHEERMPPPPPGGGYHDSYGTADVLADQRGAAPPPPPPGRPGRRDPHYARAHYAARIAHWRARAAACEAGDLAACEGPGD